MKKTILLILSAAVFATNATAQNVTIPDANFKAYLVADATINTNSDTEIQVAEATAYSGTIDCVNLSISSLSGISSFVNITGLNCAQNSLSGTLDLSANTALTSVQCNNNNLTSINLSNSLSLQLIRADYNSITSISLPDTANVLTNVNINFNSFTSLDFLQNTPNLVELHCHLNSLSTIQLSGLNSLLNVICSNNSIDSLDVSGNPAMRELYCSNNNMTYLNVGTNSVFQEVDCPFNQLTSLDLTGIPALKFLNCSDNLLTSLDLSASSNLVQLNCWRNDITAIDITNKPELWYIGLGQNELTTLTIDSGAYSVECQLNTITTITTDNAITLSSLTAYNNTLTDLDVSSNADLTSLRVDNNQLKNLNVQNGNNLNLGTFLAYGNPDLLCIQVDDIAYANTTWSVNVDSTTSFDTLCMVICTVDNSISLSGTTLSAAMAGVSYQWLNCADNAAINGATLQDFTPTVNGSYACIINDGNCVDTSTCQAVTITVNTIGESEKSKIAVYPNPTSGILNIASNNNIISLHVIDMIGKTHCSIAAQTTQIDISDLTDGVYMLQVVTSEGLEQMRFIKE